MFEESEQWYNLIVLGRDNFLLEYTIWGIL